MSTIVADLFGANLAANEHTSKCIVASSFHSR